MSSSNIVMVQVPEGANPGSTIQVVNPTTGQPFQVQVPAGVYPGQTFQVQMASPAVAQAQPMYNQAPPQTVIIHESHQPYDNDKGGGDGCCACLLGVGPGDTFVVERQRPVQTGAVVTEGIPLSDATMCTSPVQEAVVVPGPPAQHHHRTFKSYSCMCSPCFSDGDGCHCCKLRCICPCCTIIRPHRHDDDVGMSTDNHHRHSEGLGCCSTAVSSDSETSGVADGSTVAVIGSGLAGLTTAWALCNGGDISGCRTIRKVTIYERSDKLGLCSQSLSYSPTLTVDVPYRATSGAYYPTLTRLCRKLGIRFVKSDWSISCTRAEDPHRRPFFEFRNWVISIGSFSIKLKVPIVSALSSLLFTLCAIFNIIYFTLTMPSPTSATHLRHITIADWMASHAYPNDFIYNIFLPWLAIFCSLSVESAALCPADVAVEFLRAHWGDARTFWKKWSDLGDDNCIRRFAGNGIRTLAEKLVDDSRIVVKLSAEVNSLDALLNLYDYVVVATEAPTAGRLLKSVDADRSSLLDELRHERSVVWMHRDQRMLPDTTNTAWRPGLNLFIKSRGGAGHLGAATESTNAYVSVYLPSCDSELREEMKDKGEDMVIQTWSPLDLMSSQPKALLREPSYFTRPVLTVEYFNTVATLSKLNGRHRVYLAGSYSYAGNRKIPLLENAMLSGISAAAKILDVGEDRLLYSTLGFTQPFPQQGGLDASFFDEGAHDDKNDYEADEDPLSEDPEAPPGGAWKLLYLQDQWQQLHSALTTCAEQMGVNAAQLASDTIPLSRFDKVSLSLRNLLKQVEDFCKQLEEQVDAITPEFDNFYTLVQGYEDEVNSYKAARQQAIDALDKITDERDHARKMQKLEADTKERIAHLLEVERKAKIEALALLDTAKKERDRALLRVQSEQADKAAAMKLVEEATAAQRAAAAASEKDKQLRENAEKQADDERRQRRETEKTLESEKKARDEIAEKLENEKKLRADQDLSAEDAQKKIDELQGAIDKAVADRDEAVSRIEAAEKAADEAEDAQ
ncbi:hypothetical protein FOZ62_009971, partial [Perkinsus olseni]